MGDLSGRNLGPYRVLEQLGAGGMATVYKAYHAAMDRYVAVKVLPQHLAQDPAFRARFAREARTIARLEHRHILPVYDVAEDDGIPYLVMRYTDGGDLSGLIAGRQLTIERAVDLVAQVADALAYAHGQGVIHRDVKPANVLIGRDGDALLSDFGIAKIYAETSALTSEGAMIGTPTYMAPEQLRGKAVDARSDVYALGVVLYQALTGECPFEAETPLAVAMMHIYNPLRPPRQLNPAIPESIERIVLRAMAKSPDDRFQTAGELAAALRAARPASAKAAAQTAQLPRPVAEPPVAVASSPTPVQQPDALSVAPAVAEPPAAPALAAANPARPARSRPIWLAGAAVALLAFGALAFFLSGGMSRGRIAAAPPAAAPAAQAGAGATSPPAPDARQALDAAMRQLDKNDGGAALETLKPALEAHPDDPDLLAARGIANALYTGADEARKDIERALSLAPNSALAYYARGFLNQRTDKSDDAIADFTRAIALDPNFARAYYQRSVLLSYPKNDSAGARRDVDRAIELNPDLIAARMSRAWSLYYDKQLDGSLADVDHVLGLEPKNSDALRLRALVYAGMNRPAEARRDFEAAVAAAPEDKNIRNDRAEFLVRQGDYAAALVDADKLVALDGADPQWHGLRGFILHALGRDDQALAAFEKTLLIAGNEAWAARYGRGLALLGLGRAKEALDDLLAAETHSDDDTLGSVGRLFYGTPAMPAIDLGRAYGALGQNDKALQALDAAIQQDESFAAFFERGRARAAAGNTAGAREDFQEALRRALEAKNDKQRAQVEAELAKLR